MLPYTKNYEFSIMLHNYLKYYSDAYYEYNTVSWVVLLENLLDFIAKMDLPKSLLFEMSIMNVVYLTKINVNDFRDIKLICMVNIDMKSPILGISCRNLKLCQFTSYKNFLSFMFLINFVPASQKIHNPPDILSFHV